jgi:signal transduction histidine kinase/AmiR/NasT family two-component response regulator
MTRVLVVEDSPTQAQALVLVLESEGFDVESAPDGVSGLARCKATPFDVVLSDVVMPEMDGYELCKQLKANPGTSGVPVILLTSLADPMDIVRGLECGADNFITKPYDPQYLLGRLRRLLDNKALRSGRKIDVGVEVLLMGKRFIINSAREQMLDLLISTFEEVLRSREREYDAKLSEETARESHRFLQSALDALPAQIGLLDADGTIIAVNAAWRRLSEAKHWPWPEAGVGAKYVDIYRTAFGADREEDDKIQQGLRSVQSGEQPSYEAEYAAWVNSEPRWFALSATRFEDRGAHLIAVEHHDITSRKHLEQQFRHSQKMEAIGQLAGGVAHDFNNLLTVITGYADLLAHDLPVADAKREDLNEIIQAVSRAAALTRQLLAFSRKQVVMPTVLDINTAVSELERMLLRLIGEDIDYSASLDPELGRVRADSNQVQQVLMNLVVNARDAMPSGGKITVETSNAYLDEFYAAAHPDVRAGRYVMLAVSDSGLGMDATTQARIFEPFFTTKAVGKGTGLGLSTVYGIVQQSGGHIWLYSEPGFGTTFKIYLPRVDQAVAEVTASLPSKQLERRPSESVLIVEDNEAVRSMLCRVLRTSGYRVLEAANANAALQVCAAQPLAIDMLISDVVMPEMSGIDLATQLKRAHPSMRVLLMSGYSGTAMMRHGEIRSDIPFLEKPFNPETITRKVREVLDQAQTPAELG